MCDVAIFANWPDRFSPGLAAYDERIAIRIAPFHDDGITQLKQPTRFVRDALLNAGKKKGRKERGAAKKSDRPDWGF